MLFIARRYLFSHKSHSVVNIIAGVSLLAVAVPVAAVIVLLSVFNGFGGLVESMNSAVEAELTISPTRGRYFDISRVDSVALRGVEGVEEFSFVREQNLMLEHNGREATVTLRGVDESYVRVVPIGEQMRWGGFEVTLGDLDRLVLGSSMAQSLGVRRGVQRSAVNIYSLKESKLSAYLPVVSFDHDSAFVAGVFMLDAQSEEQIAYTSLRLMHRLTTRADEVSSVVMKLRGGYPIKDAQRQVQTVVGKEFKVQRREELNPLLYDIIRYEKWGVIFISVMVMLIASFSLIGIVAMLIIEKRGDMTTLRAMGATWGYLRRLFFMQGMLISGAGATLGVVVGVGLTLVQRYWGVVTLPQGAFVLEAYPVEIVAWDVVGVVGVSLAIAALLNYIVTKEMIRK